MELYLYSSCSSCRKADALLSQSGVSYTKRDYFKNRFTRKELSEVLQRARATPSEVVSTRAKSYRDLGLDQRTVSDDELLDMMIQEPTLLKRPITIGARGAVVGFNAAWIDALIAAER